MISHELVRRYPFFSGLNHDQIAALAMAGEEIRADEGHCFFREGDKLRNLYLVVEGKIAIAIAVTDHGAKQNVAELIVGNYITEDLDVSSVGPGQIFAWSAFIPPNVSTASARATTPCRVVAFDCEELMQIFQDDCQFGYLMLQKVAGVIRQRMRDMRIQSMTLAPV